MNPALGVRMGLSDLEALVYEKNLELGSHPSGTIREGKDEV